MIGLGTIINVSAILLAGIIGTLFGSLLKERHQTTLRTACGISVLFIGIAGAMREMLILGENGKLGSSFETLIVICLVLGGLVGELINFEGLFEKFGEWLKQKSGNEKDKTFINAFVTATFTVCIGAMAIIGSINDGISGDYSILLTKSILDFIIIVVMCGSMGKGCIFSAIPVLILQGGVTLLSRFIQPIMTVSATANLSLIGSILIFCVGINLVWDKKIPVANLLPSVIFAVAFAFLPVSIF